MQAFELCGENPRLVVTRNWGLNQATSTPAFICPLVERAGRLDKPAQKLKGKPPQN
ncbi:hypothetical protein ROS1_42320 [Roseibium sp. ROS1]